MILFQLPYRSFALINSVDDYSLNVPDDVLSRAILAS